MDYKNGRRLWSDIICSAWTGGMYILRGRERGWDHEIFLWKDNW